VGRFASLSAEKYGTKYFSVRKRTSNIPEAAPEASRSFSVSEKLARYGSSALSGVEHLTLLVGRKSVAIALIRQKVTFMRPASKVETFMQRCAI
jgi:hypothetical protein